MGSTAAADPCNAKIQVVRNLVDSKQVQSALTTACQAYEATTQIEAIKSLVGFTRVYLPPSIDEKLVNIYKDVASLDADKIIAEVDTKIDDSVAMVSSKRDEAVGVVRERVVEPTTAFVDGTWAAVNAKTEETKALINAKTEETKALINAKTEETKALIEEKVVKKVVATKALIEEKVTTETSQLLTKLESAVDSVLPELPETEDAATDVPTGDATIPTRVLNLSGNVSKRVKKRASLGLTELRRRTIEVAHFDLIEYAQDNFNASKGFVEDRISTSKEFIITSTETAKTYLDENFKPYQEYTTKFQSLAGDLVTSANTSIETAISFVNEHLAAAKLPPSSDSVLDKLQQWKIKLLNAWDIAVSQFQAEIERQQAKFAREEAEAATTTSTPSEPDQPTATLPQVPMTSLPAEPQPAVQTKFESANIESKKEKVHLKQPKVKEGLVKKITNPKLSAKKRAAAASASVPHSN